MHATGNRGGISGDLAVLLSGSALVGVGLFREDMIWMVIGFGIVTYRLVQGMLSSAKYNRILGSIIEKYEQASVGTEDKVQPGAGE